MFQLTKEEFEILRCQFGTSKRGGTRYPPFAFTEQGISMLSGVINSPRAIAVNIQIMRAFVEMRRLLIDKEIIKEQLKIVMLRLDKHDISSEKFDKQIKKLLEQSKVQSLTIQYLFEKTKKLKEEKKNIPDKKSKLKIGFKP